MDPALSGTLREQLVDRRQRLATAVSEVAGASDLVRLLQEVDAALERMDSRSYGTCEVCREEVGDDVLLQNPLVQYCLCQLNEQQLQALQDDLEMAARLQWALLPRQDERFAGWRAHFRYLPFGPVSGDYCDLIRDEAEGTLHFLVGDVSGKGVAAAFLMARLNAQVRSLIELRLPTEGVVARTNELFHAGVVPSHYATLVYGRAYANGEVEICNAGHCPPLVVRHRKIEPVAATGLPVGVLVDRAFETFRTRLSPGETLFLYTDGVTESQNPRGEMYGQEALAAWLAANGAAAPAALAAGCLGALTSFRAGAPQSDDLTLMAIGRTG